jgi:hypothetical protein
MIQASVRNKVSGVWFIFKAFNSGYRLAYQLADVGGGPTVKGT